MEMMGLRCRQGCLRVGGIRVWGSRQEDLRV